MEPEWRQELTRLQQLLDQQKAGFDGLVTRIDEVETKQANDLQAALEVHDCNYE